MASPMQRLISTGVTVTLHRSDPGKQGLNPLATSKLIPASTFGDRAGTAQNIQGVEVEGTASGTAEWCAVWIQHEVWFTGTLKNRVKVSPGQTYTLPRGTLRMGR